MDRLVQDLRLALRGFGRTPAFAVTAVLILALGIGMAVAMTAVFDAVLVERLPVADQARLVVPRPIDRGGVGVDPSAADVEQLGRDSRTMSGIASAWHYGSVTAPMFDGERPIPLAHVAVSANYFEVLGSRPALGRLLRRDDGLAGAAPVLVISYGAWRRQFGGDPSIVGRRLFHPYFRESFTIVGVAPPGFDYPAGVEYWDVIRPANAATLVQAVGRLAPGASVAGVRTEFLQFMRRVDRARGLQSTLLDVEVPTLVESMVGKARPVITVLTVAVALLLVIACVNVGSLLLVRSIGRSREIAIRRAIGASFGAVVRQLLVESALLAVAGGALGLAIAMMALRALSMLSAANLPRVDAFDVQRVPIGIALAVTTIAVTLFGLFPAIAAARADVSTTLRLDTRSGTESKRRRVLRQSLVASQLALALVTLAGAGLLVRSLDRLQRLDLGYTADQLTIFALAYPGDQYNTTEKLRALGLLVLPRLRAIPGVTALTPIVSPPFMGKNVFLTKLATATQSDAEADENPLLPMEVGDADYFRTFGIPLTRGRGFLDSDREGTQPVVVVSQSLARRLWPGQDAIGQVLHAPRDTTNARWTVVGVAGDTHFRELRDATPVIYQPWRQAYWNAYIAMRTTADPATVLGPMRRELAAIDSRVTLWNPRRMDELLAAPLAQPRLSTVLLSLFGAVALVLSALGLYGVMASAVREQTREIGIRMALGATPERVRRDVLHRALILLAAGAVVGLVAALLCSRLLTTMLFEVSPADPIALAASCVLLLAVGVAAALLPAHRATRIDPAHALRAD